MSDGAFITLVTIGFTVGAVALVILFGLANDLFD